MNCPEKLHQSGGKIEFPLLLSYVPWRHHIEIITKCKSLDEALFYIRKTIENGYSRSALINVVEADYYHTSGAAITNYSDRLPVPQAQLAQEITKGNYDLGFITLPANYDEKALENALEQNITRILLELGTGFAFVGRQKEIVVSRKIRKIGLLIFKDMDRTEVQWSFRNMSTPLGVATYSHHPTRLVAIPLCKTCTAWKIQIAFRGRETEGCKADILKCEGKVWTV